MAHGNEMLKTKYFFLKLPKNWFKNARIKKLRKLAGGDTYTIIYLKIMLLSMSYNSTIIYEGIEPTIEEELALKIDETAENIKVTLNYLSSCGLLREGTDGDFTLPEVNGMVGSETYGNILKKNKKLGLENFQPTSNQILTNKEKDIDIEKDKEIDIDGMNDNADTHEDLDDDLPF